MPVVIDVDAVVPSATSNVPAYICFALPRPPCVTNDPEVDDIASIPDSTTAIPPV